MFPIIQLNTTSVVADPLIDVKTRFFIFKISPFRNNAYFLYIIYSRKVQIKYIADTRLQERNQEKHMVIWL
jgi:hypothetical protein